MRVFAVALLLCLALGVCQCADKRLIALSEDDAGTWMNIDEIVDLKLSGTPFKDITEALDDSVLAMVPPAPPLPNQPQQKVYVNSLLGQLDMDNMKANVEVLSSYKTRFYSTEGGVEASEWIHATATAYASERDDVTVEYFFSNTTFPQRNVIARVKGSESDARVILGSHEDSIVMGSLGTAPGVDDDGSGTVSVLEVFRVLMANNFQPNRTIEFHFYAGEEVGLRGSTAVANRYAEDRIVVVGMMQIDMDFYIGTNDEDVVGVVTDYTDAEMNRFLRQLVDTYALINWMDTECGYGCSDHASWTANGYRSCFPFESEFQYLNPYIHTSDDTLAHASLAHGLEFAKVGLGMVVELAATSYLS